MESVAKYFKEEDDFLFEKGEVKGRKEERFETVSTMIVKMGLSDDQIATTFGFPIDYIQSVRKKIQA